MFWKSEAKPVKAILSVTIATIGARSRWNKCHMYVVHFSWTILTIIVVYYWLFHRGISCCFVTAIVVVFLQLSPRISSLLASSLFLFLFCCYCSCWCCCCYTCSKYSCYHCVIIIRLLMYIFYYGCHCFHNRYFTTLVCRVFQYIGMHIASMIVSAPI